MRRGSHVDVDMRLSALCSTYGQSGPFCRRSTAAGRSEAETQKRTLFLLEMKRGGFIQGLSVLLRSSYDRQGPNKKEKKKNEKKSQGPGIKFHTNTDRPDNIVSFQY